MINTDKNAKPYMYTGLPQNIRGVALVSGLIVQVKKVPGQDRHLLLAGTNCIALSKKEYATIKDKLK